jgi:hypothetical protein
LKKPPFSQKNDAKIAVTGMQANLRKQLETICLILYKSEGLILKNLYYELEWAGTQF